MAVEAHHLHLFSPQLLKKSMAQFVDNQSVIYNPPPMGFVNVAANDYVFPSESGVTVSDTVPRKRPRESFSFLGNDMSSHVTNQIADVDRVIVQHAEKVRMEVMERRQQFTRQIVVAVEERLSKKLKAKDEQIEQIGRVNWALEEKIKSLTNENQIWRYLAQTNEAAANALRTNLEQVLAEQVRVQEEQNFATAAAEDAKSCCGDNCEDYKDEASTRCSRRLCRNCLVREPTVLLLPCRHLCLCAKCDPAMDECPICKSFKNGSVHVNLS